MNALTPPSMSHPSDNLCSLCGEWKNEDYPICYTCSMKEKGFVMCDCGEKYYDPKRYKKCYDCNKSDRPQVDPDYPFDLPALPSV